MRDVIGILAIVAGALLLALAAGLISYSQACKEADRRYAQLRRRVARQQADLDQHQELISALWHAYDELKARVVTGEQTCDSWHDLVDVHKNAIAGVVKRVDALEDAGVLPPVEPVGATLFAETARDLLLPKLLVDVSMTPALAIGRSATVRPPDMTETAFTHDTAAQVRAALTGELVAQS